MAVRSPPPQPLPKPAIRPSERPPIKPRIPRPVNREAPPCSPKRLEYQRCSPIPTDFPSSPLTSISPVNKFSYIPRQASPVSPSAEFSKVAPLLPPNTKHQLNNQFSTQQNEIDQRHHVEPYDRQPVDYEQEDGLFSEQRQRLISAQILQKEALQRVLEDNRRQNEALRREFLRGEQQAQSSVLKITPNSKDVLPQIASIPAEYLDPVSCGDYEFMNAEDLGNSRVVMPSEMKRARSASDTPKLFSQSSPHHSKYSQSCSSWYGKSLLRYEDAVRLPDNSKVIIQGADEFLFVGPTRIKMVTTCLPLYYVRPDEHATGNTLKKFSPRISHELVRSNSTPAMDEHLYDYARPDVCAVKHKNIARIHSDVAAAVVSSSNRKLQPAHNTTLDLPDAAAGRLPLPLPKPRHLKTIGRSRSEANLVDGCDELGDAPNPYETASVTFSNSAEKISRESSISPVSGELPSKPLTFQLHFRSHCGWLVKLSKQKGLFGADKWQKRYFVLNGNRLFYFKKYGDSQPRGSIELLPGSWCNMVTQGTPKRADAQLVNKESGGIVSVLRCIALHRPSNYSNPLCRIIGSNGIDAAQSFRGHTLSLADPLYGSRTYYFVTSSDTEQKEWLDAINANIKAHQLSKDALDVACSELEVILGAVKADIDMLRPDMSRILSLIHSKREQFYAPLIE